MFNLLFFMIILGIVLVYKLLILNSALLLRLIVYITVGMYGSDWLFFLFWGGGEPLMSVSLIFKCFRNDRKVIMHRFKSLITEVSSICFYCCFMTFGK